MPIITKSKIKMLCREYSICHFERAEGESRNLLCMQISPLRVPWGRFGRNDSKSFLKSKLKTQNLKLMLFLLFSIGGSCVGVSSKSDDWYRSPEGRLRADNILSWQSPQGSWPKNVNTERNPYTGDPNKLEGTFDNGATAPQMRFLARAFRATGDSRLEQAFLKGLDHILKAQYPTGGWPQFYPPILRLVD